VAVNRNIFFEIKYAQAIKDPDERKDTITRAHQYHMWGRSKNLIISSEAKQRFDLRSPYDIANL
jgi:ribonuclease P/MRP protein subunit RPP1